MTWVVSLILFALEHAPEIISLVRQVIGLVKSLPKEQQAKAKSEISLAVKTKDIGLVKEVLSRWHHTCIAGTTGCPVDLVGE